jgi:hypothetical protein
MGRRPDASGRRLISHIHYLQRIAGWEPLRAARRLRPGAHLATVAAELTSGWEAKGDFTVISCVICRWS